MPALVIAKEFEEIIRNADAIIVARVVTAHPPVSEAPPYQVRRSEDLIPLKYDYQVILEEVLKGDITKDEMDLSYYHRGHLAASYVETGSGLEILMKPGEKYIFLLKKMSNSRFEFIRVEEFDKKEEILLIHRKISTPAPDR